METITNTLKIEQNIRSFISISEIEMNRFINKTEFLSFKKNEVISSQGQRINEVYFVEKGILRFYTEDSLGKTHTTHFVLENQFISDYSALISDRPSNYTVEALEETKLIKISKIALDWFYKNITHGEKFTKIIFDYYYQYLEIKLNNFYTLTPKERYDSLSALFPGIHQRVPQYMIASYIGVSKVHLSRIKKVA